MLVVSYPDHDRHHQRSSKQLHYKNIIFRLRPCRDPDLADQVRVLVNYCPQSSSFTSSHACNHFAACFLYFYNFKSNRFLALVVIFMGLHDQLCAGLCGRSLSVGYLGRHTGGSSDRIYDEYILSKSSLEPSV